MIFIQLTNIVKYSISVRISFYIAIQIKKLSVEIRNDRGFASTVQQKPLAWAIILNKTLK